MKYYEILNFQDEPFSNSPDPDFFYESPKHLDCLNRLEIALRLKRGLNVVLGDVGTGKTTLCRRLLRTLTDDKAIDAHLLLDPDFDNSRDLLLVLCEMLEGAAPEAGLTEWSLKERVKNCLFKRGVDNNKTTVLIIDEGQKIHDRCMELLRELLNYETNDAKLLQIVIFAQLEFEPAIRRYPNFADRINDLIRLGPLDFSNTRELIDYRINLAKVHMSSIPLFTWGGYWAMYRVTGGYPRKIVKLAHKVFLTLILNNDHRATWSLVRSVARENYLAENRKLPAAKTEIGASKSLFAAPKTPEHKAPTLDTEGDEIEGARYPWAAGLAMVLLVLIVAARAETPMNAPLIVGSAAKVDSAPKSKDDSPKTENMLVAKQEPVVTEAGSMSEHNASAKGFGLDYRASIIAHKDIPDVAKNQTDVVEPPEILGSVTVSEDIALPALVRHVYGRAGDDLVEQVVAANDSLGKQGVVPAGANVTFPVVRSSAMASGNGDARYVVRVGRYDSLEAAYNARSASGAEADLDSSKMAILPQWSEEDGLVFFLVHATTYDDEVEALRAMRTQDMDMVQTPEIVASWDDDAVMLTDVAAWRPQQRSDGAVQDLLFPPPGQLGE